MYLELVITATAVQRDLANAYTQSGRLVEIGQYFRVLNLATVLFFEQIEPAPACRKLHDSFLIWQKTGQEALSEELDAGEPVNSETSRRFAEASQHLANALATFASETDNAPVSVPGEPTGANETELSRDVS